MNRWTRRFLLIALLLLGMPYPSPAPLIYRPNEGWSYETYGSTGDWIKSRAKDQLEVAKSAFDKKDYDLTIKAAQRTVKMWATSEYAPESQYLIGRAYEAKNNMQKAFDAYQLTMEKYPKIANHQEVLQRQYKIANLFLNGKWFWKWGVIPLFSSMDKTVDLYEKIIISGIYSEVAPDCQLNIGRAREKQKDYALAAKAFERAADRYNDKPVVASEGMYRAGLAYKKQAQRAEYDQNAATQAISTFDDFITLFPNDERRKETETIIAGLKTEQARGNFMIATFYDKRKRFEGAKIYYNEARNKDPVSPYALQAEKRIAEIDLLLAAKKSLLPATNAPATPR